MAFVFLEANAAFERQLLQAIGFNLWNTNDTYLISAGDRNMYRGSVTIHALLEKLQQHFVVNVLMQEFTANNYYVHIGDFNDEQIESGEGKALFTCIFELSSRDKSLPVSEVNVTTNVQSMPTLQG